MKEMNVGLGFDKGEAICYMRKQVLGTALH